MRKLTSLTALLLLMSVATASPVVAQENIFLPNVYRAPCSLPPCGALNFVGDPTCEDMQNLDPVWFYNWAPETAPLCGIDRYPMLRDAGSDGTNDFDRIGELVGCGVFVFGPNEPNIAAQADMSLTQLVDAWRFMETELPDELLVSPAMCPPTSCVGADYYLPEFLAACVGCEFDAIAIHFYGQGDPYQAYQQFVSYYNTIPGDEPIIISEIGYWGTNEQAATFLGLVLDFAEDNPRILYINWFKVGPVGWAGLAYLVEADGTLTSVGLVWKERL